MPKKRAKPAIEKHTITSIQDGKNDQVKIFLAGKEIKTKSVTLTEVKLNKN